MQHASLNVFARLIFSATAKESQRLPSGPCWVPHLQTVKGIFRKRGALKDIPQKGETESGEAPSLPRQSRIQGSDSHQVFDQINLAFKSQFLSEAVPGNLNSAH